MAKNTLVRAPNKFAGRALMLSTTTPIDFSDPAASLRKARPNFKLIDGLSANTDNVNPFRRNDYVNRLILFYRSSRLFRPIRFVCAVRNMLTHSPESRLEMIVETALDRPKKGAAQAPGAAKAA